jgi:hypothetical protein
MRLFDILINLYKLLDIDDLPSVTTDLSDGEWSACLQSDGKLIISECHGFGSTLEDAVDDAVSRFIDHTPVINDVPLRKIIVMMREGAIKKSDG